jgi:hypothetical protein
MRKLAHSAQQGFLTIAQNSEVDYLRLAYIQAMSVKLTMSGSKYAVIVDANTNELIKDKHRKVFDYIILLEEDFAEEENWKLSNEWQTYYLTPFKETIKIESDLIFTRSIDHWWHTFRLKNIVLSHGCRDYLQNISYSRAYRKLFDDNELPDVYNGLMYFRYSQESSDFFNLARLIFNNWNWIKDNILKNCRDEDPTTDVVYALSALILGIENCTLPGIDFINFVHMKSLINGFSQQTAWPDLVVCETELPMVRINNVNQYHPLHYHEKEWITEELIENYEFELGRRIF